MKGSIRTLALWTLLSPVALALDTPKKVVDYDIKATLDPESKTVTGSETLRWTNPSSTPVPDLKFHLYWNAFRNNRSTFFRESCGRLRSEDADLTDGWGFIDLTSMTWAGHDLLKRARFEAPDDGNPDDRTVLGVPLPRPAGPGETVEIHISWKAKVPKVFARAGYVRDFFFMGQWFPKVGVFEPQGTRRRLEGGWNCHQYHANSEFYADWGDYRVEITVPSRFVVASAGKKTRETEKNGKKTLTFEQTSIHDFAWTADPNYVLREALFDPTVDIPKAEIERASRILGRPQSELTRGLRPVRLLFFMQPGTIDQWTRYADAQKWALAWLALWAFPYPYGQVSCIDTPLDGQGASGMEYQTIYTAGTHPWLDRWPLTGVRLPETLVLHEFAHSYWYGLLASNEFEESWLDEGLSSFAEYEMATRRYGPAVRLPFGAEFSSIEIEAKAAVTARSEIDPIVRTAWGYGNESSYYRNSYGRPALGLAQLQNLMGEERFWRGFRAYSERFRFEHPSSEDFFSTLGVDENPIWRDFVNRTWHGRGTIDYSIESARCGLASEFTGFDDSGKAAPPATGDTKGQKVSESESKTFLSRILVVKKGDMNLPADVLLVFEDGSTHRTSWDGRSGWLRLKAESHSRLVSATVDPDRKILFDQDPWNNARYLSGFPGGSASDKVGIYITHLFQILGSSLWGLF